MPMSFKPMNQHCQVHPKIPPFMCAHTHPWISPWALAQFSWMRHQEKAVDELYNGVSSLRHVRSNPWITTAQWTPEILPISRRFTQMLEYLHGDSPDCDDNGTPWTYFMRWISWYHSFCHGIAGSSFRRKNTPNCCIFNFVYHWYSHVQRLPRQADFSCECRTSPTWCANLPVPSLLSWPPASGSTSRTVPDFRIFKIQHHLCSPAQRHHYSQTICGNSVLELFDALNLVVPSILSYPCWWWPCRWECAQLLEFWIAQQGLSPLLIWHHYSQTVF